MVQTNYEKISLADPNFPVTFHADIMLKTPSVGFYLHWHEHIEVLHFKNGKADITLNNQQITAQKGDIVVINSNVIHAMQLKPAYCSYDCLILDKFFCDSFFIPIGELFFREKINDCRILDIFDMITTEMATKESYYKSAVKAHAISLLVLLAREFVSFDMTIKAKGESQKIKMVKKAINFLSSNYVQPVTMEEIANYVGFSKYYFCHSFKEVAGQTVMDYINGLRCSHAKKLLNSGSCNIGESAVASGFTNLSYFTKTYKRYMGVLPSSDMKIN